MDEGEEDDGRPGAHDLLRYLRVGNENHQQPERLRPEVGDVERRANVAVREGEPVAERHRGGRIQEHCRATASSSHSGTEGGSSGLWQGVLVHDAMRREGLP